MEGPKNRPHPQDIKKIIICDNMSSVKIKTEDEHDVAGRKLSRRKRSQGKASCNIYGADTKIYAGMFKADN